MEVIVPSLLAVESKRGRGQRLDLVDVVCGIVYVLHEGIRWRALPTVFGKWESVYSRLYRWTKDDRTNEMFREVVLALKRGELRSLDASYVKVHQDANVANPEDEAMGSSRAGRTTKIHALVDDVGHAVKLELTGGNINDCTLAPVMMEPVAEGETLLADKAYDVDALRDALSGRGANACIPPKSNRKNPATYDKDTYKERHTVENFFQRAKRCRRIGTRYEKTKMMYMSFVTLFAIMDYFLH